MKTSAIEAKEIVDIFIEDVIKDFQENCAEFADEFTTKPKVELKSNTEINDGVLVQFTYDAYPWYDLFSDESFNFDFNLKLSKILEKNGFYMEPENSYSSTIYLD